MDIPDYMDSQFIKETDNAKRDYVFGKCLDLIENFKANHRQTLEMLKHKYKENNFKIGIYNSDYITIEFKENTEYLIITNSHLRKISFILLTGEKKDHWLFDISSLEFYINQEKIKYPTFNYNNLDITLNEDNYNIFIKSNCVEIKENDKPDINYESLDNYFIEENKNIKLSSLTVSNERYFKDSYNQMDYDKVLIQPPFSFFDLISKMIKKILKN